MKELQRLITATFPDATEGQRAVLAALLGEIERLSEQVDFMRAAVRNLHRREEVMRETAPPLMTIPMLAFPADVPQPHMVAAGHPRSQPRAEPMRRIASSRPATLRRMFAEFHNDE